MSRFDSPPKSERLHGILFTFPENRKWGWKFNSNDGKFKIRNFQPLFRPNASHFWRNPSSHSLTWPFCPPQADFWTWRFWGRRDVKRPKDPTPYSSNNPGFFLDWPPHFVGVAPGSYAKISGLVPESPRSLKSVVRQWAKSLLVGGPADPTVVPEVVVGPETDDINCSTSFFCSFLRIRWTFLILR